MTTLRKYTDLRSWFRNLAKSSVHAGSGALLAAVGTNGAESWAPTLLKGVGMDLRQMVAVFISAAFIAALQRINKDTAESQPPFPEIKP